MLSLCSRIVAADEAEIIVRPRHPVLHISPHLDLRFLSRFAVTVTTRSATLVLFGFFSSGFNCTFHMAHGSPCICRRWKSYRNWPVKQHREIKRPQNTKALAFEHPATFRGTKPINGVLNY